MAPSGSLGLPARHRQTGGDDLVTEAALIERVMRARDEAAFRILYARHTPAVHGLLWRLSGRQADAADLTRETWLRAVRHLSLFRGQSAFSAWLTGIALACYREWRRRNARDSGSRPDLPPGPGPGGGDVSSVGLALAALSAEHREVMVLHDIEGYTTEEIAAALDIEPATSTSRLCRARRVFRDRWQGQA